MNDAFIRVRVMFDGLKRILSGMVRIVTAKDVNLDLSMAHANENKRT